MYEKLRQFLTSPILEDDDLTRIARLLHIISLTFIALVIVGGAAIFITSQGTSDTARNVMIIVAILSIEITIQVLMRTKHVQLASLVQSTALWLLFTYMSYTGGGVRAPTYGSYVLVVFTSALLSGSIAGITFAGLSILSGLIMIYQENQGHLTYDPGQITQASAVITQSAHFVLLAVLGYIALRDIKHALERARRNELSTAQANQELESRTNRLESLVTQLKGAAQMNRDIILVSDLDALLSQITTMISGLFGYYHAAVFLLDREGADAVLRAASSEEGRRMLDQSHRLQVGQESIVGLVISTGEPRTTLETGAPTAKNPVLPRSRSQMILPLKVSDRVIGALDIQSEREATFDDDSTMVLQVIADQLAVTIENARLLSATQETVREISSAAAEILAAASQQASGANEQSAAISQTTTTVDEVKTISEQSVARAQEVLDVSQRTVQVSRSGQQAVDQTLTNMHQIKSRVESIAENILALAEQAQQVGEIISTVNDIASQSNILALNASVEAARAGEHGKGFAVVAVEVRNLAEQSKQATAQVRTILSEIQNGINGTVMATEEGTKVVEEGLQLAAQTGEVIEKLARAIEESAQAATQMTAGGRQQASGVEQIAVAMQNINQATAQGLASTRQTENAAQQLNDLAGTLLEIAGNYSDRALDSSGP